MQCVIPTLCTLGPSTNSQVVDGDGGRGAPVTNSFSVQYRRQLPVAAQRGALARVSTAVRTPL